MEVKKTMKKIPNIYSKARKKILVAINSLTSAQHPAYSNHLQMMYRFGRSYPEIDFGLFNPSRMSIDRMKNAAAETAMDMEASHLLIIDDDVLLPLPFDFLTKLLACKAEITAADVLIRGWPFEHMFFRFTDKHRIGLKPVKRLPQPLGPMNVDAVGFSCCLIETALLKKLPKPFFVTGLQNTEDIYFCVLAKDRCPEIKIMVDTSIRCGHIFGAEIVDSDNIKNYRSYYKKQFKPQGDKESAFRGINYYNIVKGSVAPNG